MIQEDTAKRKSIINEVWDDEDDEQLEERFQKRQELHLNLNPN